MAHPLTLHEQLAELTLRLRAKGLIDQHLLLALEQTPRDLFIAQDHKHLAFINTLLPLACGQFIERIDEQLLIVAHLELAQDQQLLEIGTGSGFSAALMAKLVASVTTIERYHKLSIQAQKRFNQLKINNITQRHLDGSALKSEFGSFERIIIWPALSSPAPFLPLLALNGVLIAPIGEVDGVQKLMRYRKIGNRFEQSELMSVRYGAIMPGVSQTL